MNASWTKYLPEILREWLDDRQQLQKTIGNTGWLLFDRIIRMVIGITIGAWVARYLGPAQFGELAYVISFIAFFQVIADLQADGFIVRDIAQEREKISVILGTTLWLRIFFGTIAWICAAALMSLLHPIDGQLFLLTLIVGGSMIFQSAETVDLWFQSQSQSKRTVLAKLVVYLFSNCVKVILLLNKAPLVAFAGVMALESAAFAVSLAIAYGRFPTNNQWTISRSQAKTLLNQCWPFIASGLMITTYMRIDQIMLKEMLGERELGIFAAALPISNVWTIIPATLVTSLAPIVARKMRQDVKQYQDALVKVFRSFAILAVLGSLLTTVASPWIIRLLYGVQFQPSAAVLSIYVFVNIFVFQGIAQSLWVVNNNVRMVTLFGTFLAATIGILSNALLIRKFGVMGATYSILLTQGTSVVVLPCLFRRDLRYLYKRAFIPFKVYRQA
jgi:PST family polysaccharide transporter